ncbi:MAG: glycosyltransferase family 4 protein [Candidatus Cloacimonetes bacterium]|nr:glycosyltransferase family 4 protein [Candidatus Cloacimonadota bacterium]
MKKLLILSDLYPTRQNSLAGIFVRQQAEELARHYRVCVVAYTIGSAFRIERSHQGGIEACLITYPALRKPFLSAFFTFPLFALPAAAGALHRWQPDLIQVHDFRHLPELFWLKTWLDRIKQPKFLTLHNIRTHPERLKENRLLPFYRKTLPKALSGWDHVFTVNARLKNWLLPWLDENRISVLGNAIGPAPECRGEELTPVGSKLREGSYKLISVGNLTPEKGFSYLIDAVKTISEQGLDLQLVIVGKGPEQAALAAKIRASKLSDRIWLAGALENRIVRNLYPLFDLFVLPSYSETFGIVFLEAMYAGLPVLGIEGQGIHGLFADGREALYAKPRDAASLAALITRFSREPELAANLAAAGQKRVQRDFMLSGLIDKVREVYERQ